MWSAPGYYRLNIDLEQCEVSGNGTFRAPFTIDAFSRTCLLEGLDEIGTKLKHEAEIAEYERRRSIRLVELLPTFYRK